MYNKEKKTPEKLKQKRCFNFIWEAKEGEMMALWEKALIRHKVLMDVWTLVSNYAARKRCCMLVLEGFE